ncbi:FGGY-family carbohydrate kinase [Anaerobium acetethylicum]|uniref:Xylulokinase/glycerol kinase n=1 Tax=Anaerobium acetethylicum TaxID=1619234 RepID=A0A1D3TYC1_9FIRM|nr:FGGY-family carbohydrate kinase [Anaerobium acetethylicum]SCP99431.1 xylulokinase/glycerol kinase [Anaerobium acetethylicum]
MEYIITIDVGTMSMRAIIYDTSGNSLFTSSFEYHSIFTPPSLVEQNPHDWRDALNFTLKEAAQYVQSKGIKISAISVTSQRASVIPVDQEGNHLYNAVTWQDKRSVSICQQLLEKISMNKIYKKTGLRANPYFSLPKMMWFKQKAPDIYAKAHKLIGVQDYVIYQLTGEFKTDWTQAARTMLMDIKTFKWDNEMLDFSGIDENLLCELCPPGSIAGGLKKEFAEAAGLEEGIPVIMAGGDQQNAALALNILNPGMAEANTGTGSFVIAYSDKPVFDKKCRVLCSASAVPGKWIVEAGIFNTGAIYRWFREQFYSGESANYMAMNQEAAASPIGSSGVMLIPHFEGSAAPFWNPYAKGLFFNLSLGTTKGDMARAIFEGIAMEIADNFSLIEVISGDIDTISVAGGMTKSDLFNTIQSDIFYKKVVRYQNSEATSLGATMSAAVTLGIYKTYEEAFSNIVGKEDQIYEPVAENHIKYDKLRMRKHDLYNALNQRGVYEKFMKPI